MRDLKVKWPVQGHTTTNGALKIWISVFWLLSFPPLSWSIFSTAVPKAGWLPCRGSLCTAALIDLWMHFDQAEQALLRNLGSAVLGSMSSVTSLFFHVGKEAYLGALKSKVRAQDLRKIWVF